MKAIRFVLLAAASMLLVTSVASAEIFVFWKMNQCPQLGTKAPLVQEVGIIQVPVNTVPEGYSVGGPMCILDRYATVAVGRKFLPGANPKEKVLIAYNADVVVHDGDTVDAYENQLPFPEQNAYRCVICQYAEHKVGMPAVSLLGTALLLGGLLTAGAYELGRRQRRATLAA